MSVLGSLFSSPKPQPLPKTPKPAKSESVENQRRGGLRRSIATSPQGVLESGNILTPGLKSTLG